MSSISKVTKILFLALAFFVAGSGLAAERGTTVEAGAMVKKVIAAIKADGKDKTIAQINLIESPFRDRDLYITILDMHGKELAHGANRKMQGVNILEMKDEDGKPFIKERLALAKKQGHGWQDYKFVDPLTKKIEPKSMYYEMYDEIVINCGVYKPVR